MFRYLVATVQSLQLVEVDVTARGLSRDVFDQPKSSFMQVIDDHPGLVKQTLPERRGGQLGQTYW